MPFLDLNAAHAVLYLGSPGVELDENNPENRFTLDWVARVGELIDEAVAAGKPLVLTATGKFFTNGLDTDYALSNLAELPGYLDTVHALYTKVLTAPVPTIAAINGHAFAAGAMLSLCADYRIMRTERGFWSLPEVAINMPFTLGMASLISTRLPDPVATEAMLTARRYSAEQAVAAGIVEEAVPAELLLERAGEVAGQRLQFVGETLGVIKRGLRASLLADLSVKTPATLL